MDSFAIADEFKDEVEALRLPKFFVKVPGSLFSNGMTEYLRKETLLAEFSLHDQPSKINFETADDEIAEVDVLDGGGVPKVTSMDSLRNSISASSSASAPLRNASGFAKT